MKNLPIFCFLTLAIFCSPQVFAAETEPGYAIDPETCIQSLVWNKDFTQAKCKIRNGPLSDANAASSVNFTTPKLNGEPSIKGYLRPLSNGYVLYLKAETPINPEKSAPEIQWILSQIARSIATPKGGFCEKMLLEMKALFNRYK